MRFVTFETFCKTTRFSEACRLTLTRFKRLPQQPVRPRAPGGAALIVMMVCWWCHWRNGGVSAVICLQSALFATLAANEPLFFICPEWTARAIRGCSLVCAPPVRLRASNCDVYDAGAPSAVLNPFSLSSAQLLLIAVPPSSLEFLFFLPFLLL